MAPPAAVVRLVMVVGVVLAVAGCGDARVADPQRPVAVQQHGITLGDPKARVTVVAFIDPQCPLCREVFRDSFPWIVRDEVRSGKVRCQLRTLSFLGPDSIKGAKFLQAAGFQSKMFNATELLYRNQGEENSGYMTDDFLKAIGNRIPGFDTARALHDMDTAGARRALREAEAVAQRYRVRGVPTLLVGPTDGALHRVRLEAPADMEAFGAAIQRAVDAAG